MIIVKSDHLKKKINKSIADIARQTRISRNTLSALFHNKAHAITFDVVDKLCSNYLLSIDDIFEFRDNTTDKGLYRQEAESVITTVMMPANSVGLFHPAWFEEQLTTSYLYFKNDYCYWYWLTEESQKAANWIFHKYSNQKNFDRLWNKYSDFCSKIEKLYDEHTANNLNNYSDSELTALFKSVVEACKSFWSIGLFIDTFDPGFDQDMINKIAKQNNFSLEEVIVLTTPYELTFDQERKLDLLRIASKKTDKKHREQLLSSHANEFDYVKSTYGTFDSYLPTAEKEFKAMIDREEVAKEIKRLTGLQTKRAKEVQKVLELHHLKDNPLVFFQRLIYWREHRKKYRIMALNLIWKILLSIENRSGISYNLLAYLMPDEIELVFSGLITSHQLQKRHDGPIFIECQNGSHKFYVGDEAKSLHEEVERKWLHQKEESEAIQGQVASQGYAKGVARIIFGERDFNKFKEGEVLVTGMTRPEFLPLMRKAVAIVTNEGGVTCHAAIVSRELGKPCIIGTRVATDKIKNGDLIEVRANHGTVRILGS